MKTIKSLKLLADMQVQLKQLQTNAIGTSNDVFIHTN